jgi:hypothetical protein
LSGADQGEAVAVDEDVADESAEAESAPEPRKPLREPRHGPSGPVSMAIPTPQQPIFP